MVVAVGLLLALVVDILKTLYVSLGSKNPSRSPARTTERAPRHTEAIAGAIAVIVVAAVVIAIGKGRPETARSEGAPTSTPYAASASPQPSRAYESASSCIDSGDWDCAAAQVEAAAGYGLDVQPLRDRAASILTQRGHELLAEAKKTRRKARPEVLAEASATVDRAAAFRPSDLTEVNRLRTDIKRAQRGKKGAASVPSSRVADVDVNSLRSAPAETPPVPVVQPTITPSITPAPSSSRGACAENGSCYGDLSAITGRPKTIQVRGYYRKDGTYVRGHYRSHR